MEELIQILKGGSLRPQQAGKLAGKLTFLTRTLMGRTGRAAIKAIYARQYATSESKSLGPPLKAALWALLSIVQDARPREIALVETGGMCPIVYADAFVKIGERTWRLAESEEFGQTYDSRHPEKDGVEDNGYGVVVFGREPNAQPLYFYGKIPKDLLLAYAPDGQYIFVLEALAQCLAYWICWPFLKGPYWSFIDNSAAQWALTKGYSSLGEANILTSLFWSATTQREGEPWFERVPSKANCSDAVSRADTKSADEAGWKRLNLDLAKIWHILRQALDTEEKNLPRLAEELCGAAKAANK